MLPGAEDVEVARDTGLQFVAEVGGATELLASELGDRVERAGAGGMSLGFGSSGVFPYAEEEAA